MRCSTFAFIALAAIIACAQSGCASYATPGRGADLAAVGVTPQMRQAQTPPDIARILDRKPLAAFPTAIAVVRVQAPGYQSLTARGFGDGRYSVVTTRDVEKPKQFERLQSLPMVSGIAPMNRLLLSPHLESDQALREASAQLHADMLLVYTLDTTFSDIDKAVPVSVVTLGLAPSRNIRVTTTASAVLMDTRNGYIYGLAEATDQRERNTSAWQKAEAVDETRLEAESAAFDKLVGELEGTWAKVLKQYAAPAHAARP